jgi:diacylglycerol kinase (ATP)
MTRAATGHHSGVRVIWNPNAGQKNPLGSGAESADALRELLASRGLEAEILASDSAENARRMAAAAVKEGCSMVVAAGGDGTVGLIARELLDSRTALGVLPLGSVMNIARMLGLPRDLEGAADALAAGWRSVIDVGQVRGEPFFETASVGMNAAMFREIARLEEGDYGSPLRALWVAIRYRPARMQVILDEETIHTRALMVTVSNGPYMGMAMTVAPSARLDDGRFDVRVFRHFSKLDLLRHLGAIAFGRRRYSPHVSDYRSRAVRIESPRLLPCRADSRDLGVTPLECVVRPQCLTVIVGPDYPAPADT